MNPPGIAADEAQLRHEFGSDHFDRQTLLLACRQLGLSARCVVQPIDRLDKAPLPAIAFDNDGHAFIAARVDAGTAGAHKILIQRPGEAPAVLTIEAFRALWSGDLMLMTSQANFVGELAKFDFSWFVPAVVKYRRLLGEILLVSLTLQLIGLVRPMFFQVVLDKVLVNHAMKTLNVIAIGLVVANVFEALLSGIRTWVFAHTSSKMDVELGARLFRHLLNLPMAYFQSRRVGDSVARIRELENIHATRSDVRMR